MKRAKMQSHDKATDGGLQMGSGKNEGNSFKKLKSAGSREDTSTQGDRTGDANVFLTQLYLQNVRSAEHDCMVARKNGDKTELARMTEHVSNLKEHDIDGFMKFREHGDYSFVSLRSGEESSESDEESTISALSGGAVEKE